MSGYIGTQPVPQATQTRDSFTATSGQTSFATGGYTPNFLDVYLNGVKLASADYTATNGSDVVLASGAATGDILEVVAFTTFSSDDRTLNNAGTVLTTNRTGSDGTIVDLQKDGSTVGSVGVLNSNNLTISGTVADHGGLQFGTHTVLPMEANADSNGTVDLGGSGSRFKDAYLSGGVYLGGTGSANKLEDYEEGTWTPTVTAASGSVNAFGGLYGTYTKIGREVSLHFQFIVTDVGSSSGNFIVGSLPFAKETSTLTYYLGIHRARSGTSSISELTSSGALHLYGTTPINSTYLGSIVYTTA